VGISELTFDVEFALTKDHPSYKPPPPSETECFRRGTRRSEGEADGIAAVAGETHAAASN
jgi:hypothetical protein